MSDEDCSSSDACWIPACVLGFCTRTLRDRDADGYVDGLCGGSDCNDLNHLAYPGATEACTDGTDNDCNGVSDCFDPVCEGGPCGCQPASGGEDCSSGMDDDCDGAIDCGDTDCLGTVDCGCTTESCTNSSDDDCDDSIDCDDSDCAGHPACVCAAKPEICSNGADEDCDGLVDCSDPDCVFSSQCLCLIPKAEVCGDGKDNDCDGLVDCGDPNCFTSTSCAICSTEQCESGQDEDCDGLIDCSDPTCAFDDACPPRQEECDNDRDDDLDGLGDCNDPDCENTQICRAKQNTCRTARVISPLASAVYEGDTSGQLSNFHGSCGGAAGEAVFRLELNEPLNVHLDTVGTSFDSVLYVRRGSCAFGLEIGCDDDSGGFQWSSALDFPLLEPGTYFIYVDGLTVDVGGGPNEGPYVLNVEVSPVVEICGDQLDNDDNGYADCADVACSAEAVCMGCNDGEEPVAEYGTSRCTDGEDNDCDGFVDCLDDDCSASDENITECCNGIDQNGNGIPDDFNCRCRSNLDCSGGQLCYTSTVGACGIPCDNFFGEICPFLAPGSSCNLTTRQCEY